MQPNSGMCTVSPDNKNIPVLQRPVNYLLPQGEHGSVSKMPVRGSLPRPHSALTRSRPQSQFSSACSMISLKQRKVYLVDFNAVVAKATGCPLKVDVSATKPQLNASPTTNGSPMDSQIPDASLVPVSQSSPIQSSPMQAISNDSSPIPPLVKCDPRPGETIKMEELLQLLSIKQSRPPFKTPSFSIGSSYKDTESLPESSTHLPAKQSDILIEISDTTSELRDNTIAKTTDETVATSKPEDNEIAQEKDSNEVNASESIPQPIQNETPPIKLVEPLEALVQETKITDTSLASVDINASLIQRSKSPTNPPERPPRPKLRSSPLRKAPERPPLPKSLSPSPRKPPQKPPYPSHLMDVFLPKGETALVNLTQFIEERSVDKSERYLDTGMWTPTCSEDSLQWGEPCLRRRPRVPPRPRFMAGSHGDVNLSAALPTPSTSNFAKSIDNMHLCEYISQSVMREGILASVEALQQKSPQLNTYRTLYDDDDLHLDDYCSSLSFLSPRIQRRRTRRQRAARGRSMEDEFYKGYLEKKYLNEDSDFRF